MPFIFGGSFGVQAETLEDLYEWKAALENALAQAPTAALVIGQNGVLKNGQAEAADGATEQCMLLLIIINLIGLQLYYVCSCVNLSV